MNRLRALLLPALLLGLLSALPQAAAGQTGDAFQAIVLKAKNDVTRRPPNGQWEKAVPLDPLGAGHQIRTGAASFTLIRFADETKLVIREKSIVEISGDPEARTVNTNKGGLAFDVKKQDQDEFRFTSPTSVASIRGTTGNWNVLEDGTSEIAILTGSAALTNLQTGASQNVGAGQLGTSDAQGNLGVRNLTPFEQRNIDTALGGQPTQTRTLRIIGRDANGQRTVITIEWEEQQ